MVCKTSVAMQIAFLRELVAYAGKDEGAGKPFAPGLAKRRFGYTGAAVGMNNLRRRRRNAEMSRRAVRAKTK